MAKKETMEQKRHKLLLHLLDKGWKPDIKRIEDFSGKEVFELETLILGKYSIYNYLTSSNGIYKIVLEIRRLTLTKYSSKGLKLRKLGNWPIGKISLIEKGFSIKADIAITEVILSEEEIESGETSQTKESN